mgnify:CR=1 FL=1
MIHPEQQRRAYLQAMGIDVWLPRGYEDSGTDYRVLYFHDGQNVFNREWV